MDAERLRITQDHNLDPALLSDNAAQRSLTSISIVQDILRPNKAIAMDELLNRYFQRFLELR